MSFLLTILILCLALNNPSEAKHEKNLTSAVVVGTVYCDTCFQVEFSKPTHFISGASVAVECGGTSSIPRFFREVKTDDHGVFKVSLPFSVTKHVKKIKRCTVKLISSNEPYCSVTSTATSSSPHLKSSNNGIHIFSAGFFSFKPIKQPDLCTQTTSFKNSEKSDSFQSSHDPSFPKPLQDPLIPFLPPMDNYPFHHGKSLPGHPNIPLLPKKKTHLKNTNTIKTTQKLDQQEFFQPGGQIPSFLSLPFPIQLPPIPPFPTLPPIPPFPTLPPIPLFPPLPFSIPLPPNPFQPPSFLPHSPIQPLLSSPSKFPPIQFQHSPPTPSMNFPPSPPPSSSVPTPAFPLPPSPGFPEIPPASSPMKNSP